LKKRKGNYYELTSPFINSCKSSNFLINNNEEFFFFDLYLVAFIFLLKSNIISQNSEWRGCKEKVNIPSLKVPDILLLSHSICFETIDEHWN
jgi:hypothetical protein